MRLKKNQKVLSVAREELGAGSKEAIPLRREVLYEDL